MRGTKPAKSFTNFVRWVRKQGIDLEQSRWLDLGSGEGKNALYLADRGAHVKCIEIAHNAVVTTQESAKIRGFEGLLDITEGSIGETYDLSDDSVDVVVDVTSSNSLDESEREVYLSESKRVLKPGGYMFVRALCKDGDNNAKQLIADYPGAEHDTYVMPEWGLTERVFTEAGLRELYGQYFDIIHLEKETHYTTLEKEGKTQKYKRNFWVMYLQK